MMRTRKRPVAPRLWAAFTIGLLACTLVLAGCDSSGGTDIDENSLADILGANNDLSTLLTALETTGQVQTLGNQDATYTVFAPRDAAFANIDVGSLTDNPEPLRDLLNFHIVRGEALTTSALAGREQVTTVEGQQLAVESRNGTLTVGGVAITQANVEASNGVAHIVDGVLIPDSFPRRVSYDLAAQSNGGAVPDGAAGTVTFWEYTDSQTLVTLELADGPTEADLSHPAHIHENTASETGRIAIYLSPLDGTNANGANEGASARLVDRSFDSIITYDGHVNIHESVNSLGEIVAQGNIGANATGTLGTGLQVVDNPQSVSYALAAQSNNGSIPDGLPGEVRFRQLTAEQTLATVRLDADGDGTFEDGATGATVSHPVHIHQNSVSEDGSIQIYLSPVDGTDPAARSSQIIDRPLSELTGFDGYVNVHESADALQNVVAQGNIGANAGN